MSQPASIASAPANATQTGIRSGIGGLPQRLVQDGLLDESAMMSAMAESRERRVQLVTWLVTQKLVAAREVAIAASQEFGVPLFDLDALVPDQDTIRLVSEKLLAKHRVLPLAKRGKRLHVAVSDPTNLHGIDEIKFQTGLTIEAVVVEDDKLQDAVNRAIEVSETSVLPKLDEEGLELDSLDVEIDEAKESEAVTRDDVEDAPIVRYVNKVMLDAIRRGASDIHFEPYEKQYRVRIRVDGVLREVAQPPVQLSQKLAARIKVMSRLDIAERRVPQDGRIKMKLSKSRSIDFRVSSCPTLFGEKIVLRILDASAAMMGIDALGYEPFQKDLYMAALAKPQGMILVTGPTGSGKTVSLYTGIGILNTEGCNISTAEDPAEIVLPGVNQVNVNNRVGLTFASALRAFLRQDPDVIMVGEIRDLETAEIAVKASQTGHLVLSTLHTNDAPQSLTRLMDMGVKPYSIATAVSLIIAQRLARRLCQNCKEPVKIPVEAAIKEGFSEEEANDPKFRVHRPVGCNQCTDGYRGRVGIYEVMPVTDPIGRIILAGGSAPDIRDQASKEGVWDLRTSGLHKVRTGMTSLEEVNRVTVE